MAGALSGYEDRPQQQTIAVEVARAIEEGYNLVAEAGTGCGKTLAYLAPALASGLRVVVSTGTKNLQDQIIYKELPLLERAAKQTFAVQLMKGRTNYLCEHRFEQVAAQIHLPGFETHYWREINRWRSETHTGDRTEIANVPEGASIWRDLTVSADQCIGRRCSLYESCWATRMRRRAQESKLVIVNHHLFFADAALRHVRPDASILPPHDLVIFDEAHGIDEVAAQHYGIDVSENTLYEMGHDITRATSAHPSLARALALPLGQVDLETRRLFDSLPCQEGRARLESHDLTPTIRQRFSALRALLSQLGHLLADADDDMVGSLKQRVQTVSHGLAFALGVSEELDPPGINTHSSSQEEWVRFTVRRGRTRAVVARPIDVAPLLARTLDGVPSLFLSATLTVDGRFDYYRRRVGIDTAHEVIVSSPFDYSEQAALYVPSDLPPPHDERFSHEMASRCCELVQASGGGALILCTSYRSLESVRRLFQQSLPDQEVWVQGDRPRTRLLELFRAHGNATLIATMSFWQGVDVPGSALRLVIVDKLPFASPTDPMVAARIEVLERQGISAFRHLQIPHAALLLRQGFGRLIRHQQDRGLVAILDPRMVTRPYGRIFLRSLPNCPRLESLSAACAFLAQAGPTEHDPSTEFLTV